jgi:hypothetical protein
MTPQSRREKWRGGLRDHIAAGVGRRSQTTACVIGEAHRACGLGSELGRFAQNLVGGVVGIGESYRAVVLAQHAPGGVEGARGIWRLISPVGLDFPVAVVEDRGANLPGTGRVAHFRRLLKHSVNRDSDSKSTA